MWQKLLPFFYTFKTSWRERWNVVFDDQEELGRIKIKSLDSYVSLPVLMLYRLFSIVLFLDDSCCLKGRGFAEPHGAGKEQQKPHKWQPQSHSGFTLYLLTLARCFYILSLRHLTKALSLLSSTGLTFKAQNKFRNIILIKKEKADYLCAYIMHVSFGFLIRQTHKPAQRPESKQCSDTVFILVP